MFVGWLSRAAYPDDVTINFIAVPARYLVIWNACPHACMFKSATVPNGD